MELDVSASAASEQLRRAQTQLIEETATTTWPSLPELTTTGWNRTAVEHPGRLGVVVGSVFIGIIGSRRRFPPEIRRESGDSYDTSYQIHLAELSIFETISVLYILSISILKGQLIVGAESRPTAG